MWQQASLKLRRVVEPPRGSTAVDLLMDSPSSPAPRLAPLAAFMILRGQVARARLRAYQSLPLSSLTTFLALQRVCPFLCCKALLHLALQGLLKAVCDACLQPSTSCSRQKQWNACFPCETYQDREHRSTGGPCDDQPVRLSPGKWAFGFL